MAKYLKISVSGPYINTERTAYVPVDDDFVKDSDEDNQLIENEVWEYVESWSELVDEADVPVDERA
ncbi:hypothetical protein PQC18_gp58 [Streptomyces phage Pablito]|uniref:Uncharacterized protein n=1 Tax=Streptomyces phage Pablito TaxID=2894593 RepID=A0AAE8YFB6_9CAUD|nr:hypothetical protein PQC18_gp58 [Streptomyces phage Pablito]UFD97996.1 hypothetical protein [Streptomyces phage Pablito]